MTRRAVVALSTKEREALRTLTVSAAQARVRHRAEIVLLADEGLTYAEISRRLNVAVSNVARWTARFRSQGVAGLEDRPRTGRPKRIDEAQILAASDVPPPRRLGATRWTTRLLAAELGVSNYTVAKVWRSARAHPRCDIDRSSRSRQGVGT